MKKSLFTVLAIFAFTILMAQDVMLRKDDKVLSLGVGFGTNLYSGSFYSSQLPVFSASFELGFMDDVLDIQDLNLGLGALVGFTTAKQEWSHPTIGLYGYDYNFLIVGGRAAVHYPFVDNLDTYTGLLLGAKIVTSQSFGTPTSSVSADGSGVAYSWFLGGRYYFSDRFAGMAEVGFGVTNVTLGLAVKF